MIYAACKHAYDFVVLIEEHCLSHILTLCFFIEYI